MQDHLRAFVEFAVEAFELRGPVYDFCPCDGDRQAVAPWRPLFLGQKYVRCGVQASPWVDRLVEEFDWNSFEGAAGTVISIDLLQRVFEPRRATEEFIRVLAPGGVLLVASAPDSRRDPADFWSLTPNCMGRLLAPLSASLVGWQGAERSPHTVFGIGYKAPLSPGLAHSVNRFIESYQSWLDNATRLTPWSLRIKATAARWFAPSRFPHSWRDDHQVRFSLDLPFDEHGKAWLLPAHHNITAPARLDLR
jgi:hypothetical protein